MVLIKDPDTGGFALMLPNAAVGSAAREDGTILIRIKDIDTELPILVPFDPETFGDIVKQFQKTLGRRIVTADMSDLREETGGGKAS